MRLNSPAKEYRFHLYVIFRLFTIRKWDWKMVLITFCNNPGSISYYSSGTLPFATRWSGTYITPAGPSMHNHNWSVFDTFSSHHHYVSDDTMTLATVKGDLHLYSHKLESFSLMSLRFLKIVETNKREYPQWSRNTRITENIDFFFFQEHKSIYCCLPIEPIEKSVSATQNKHGKYMEGVNGLNIK